MGRMDRTWSDEQIADVISLVTEQAWSIPQAAKKHEMPVETARKYIATHLRESAPALDPDNPIGQMTSELIAIANGELAILKAQHRNPNNKRVDLERASKLTKLLVDLDKLRKGNQAPKKAAEPTSPLAALVNTQPSQSGSVSDARNLAVVSLGNASTGPG